MFWHTIWIIIEEKITEWNYSLQIKVKSNSISCFAHKLVLSCKKSNLEYVILKITPFILNSDSKFICKLTLHITFLHFWDQYPLLMWPFVCLESKYTKEVIISVLKKSYDSCVKCNKFLHTIYLYDSRLLTILHNWNLYMYIIIIITGVICCGYLGSKFYQMKLAILRTSKSQTIASFH